MTEARQLGMLPRVFAERWPGPLQLRLGLVLLAACGCSSGTETGNPSLTGSLSYTGYSSAPQQYGVGERGSIASIETAWFALDQVTVSASGACALDTQRSFVAPALGVGDHAAGNHNSTVFEANPGAFCTVELPFVDVPSAASQPGLPAELPGHSILLTGMLADGTPFTIVSDATPVVQLRSSSAGFELAASQADVLIAFDFASWLGSVDFVAAALDSEGSLVISSEQNSELLEAFDAELPAGVALYRDRDVDGLVDEEPELLAESR